MDTPPGCLIDTKIKPKPKSRSSSSQLGCLYIPPSNDSNQNFTVTVDSCLSQPAPNLWALRSARSSLALLLPCTDSRRLLLPGFLHEPDCSPYSRPVPVVCSPHSSHMHPGKMDVMPLQTLPRAPSSLRAKAGVPRVLCVDVTPQPRPVSCSSVPSLVHLLECTQALLPGPSLCREGFPCKCHLRRPSVLHIGTARPLLLAFSILLTSFYPCSNS